MEKTRNLTCVEETAKEVVVEVNGLEAYKDAFLAIFNNVRDDRRLYRVTNNSKNAIFVDCRADALEAVKEWLAGFGEVKNVYDVLVLWAEEPMDEEYFKHEYADSLILFEN